jgi:hypothetical protein
MQFLKPDAKWHGDLISNLSHRAIKPDQFSVQLSVLHFLRMELFVEWGIWLLSTPSWAIVPANFAHLQGEKFLFWNI